RLVEDPAYRNWNHDWNMWLGVTEFGTVFVLTKSFPSRAMTTSVQPHDQSGQSSETPPASEAPSRARWRRLNPAAQYALLFLGLAVVVVAGQFALHAMHTAPRDSQAIADRELKVNVLSPGERVITAVSVLRRSPIDYFRATRGELVLTDKRMVFLGLRPRDLLAATDAPPT